MSIALFWSQLAIAQGPSIAPGLRTQALEASRILLDAAGHRFVDPVVLTIEGDSAEVIESGFTEGLIEEGIIPRVGSTEESAGTHVRIRSVPADSSGFVGFDVRVERLPERSVVYSRLLFPSAAEEKNGSEGFLDRVVVPTAAIGAAVLVIYLLFTVRS